MKRRIFRLATVLRVRERQLQAAQAELARLRREQENERRDGERLLAEAVSAGRDLDARLVAGSSAGILQSASLAGDRLRAGAGAAASRAEALEAPVAQARAGVLDAKRRVRGLELLEEKSRQRLRVEQLRSETRVLDEIGTRSREEGRS